MPFKGMMGKGREAFSRISSGFLSALFPEFCLGCGVFLERITGADKKDSFPEFPKGFMQADIETVFRMALDTMMCQDCLDTFQAVTSPFCIKCGTVFQSREGNDRLCGACLKNPGRYRMARAAGVFQGSLLDAIHLFKYQGKLQLAKPLSRVLLYALMVYAHEFAEGQNIDMIVPVPLHPKRFRERGFNQAYLLIQHWEKMAASFGRALPYISIERHVLIRKKYTDSQTGLGKKERQKNINGAFQVSGKIDIRNKRVLLVDDVYTTGSTVNECVGVLLKGGARYVDILTLARTV
ncbi:MAG: ComF family protein [Proteobacteria bacterium]|nr:ComF family protein [Pseudomonadota bacterium]